MKRWEKHANCKGQYQLFFPEDGEDKERRELREAMAKALCWACAVREHCLAWAMRNELKALDGIWGGHNHLERAALRRKHSWNEYQQSLLVPA